MSGFSDAKIRLRIVMGDDHRIGPGKVDLLEAIARTGSIAAGGRELGMSYRRAWLLVDALNTLFNESVVTTAAGGVNGGGAQLTPLGRALVAAFREVEKQTQAAMIEAFAPFSSHLRAN